MEGDCLSFNRLDSNPSLKQKNGVTMTYLAAAMASTSSNMAASMARLGHFGLKAVLTVAGSTVESQRAASNGSTPP